jgi:hypothetical protein
MTHFVRSFVMLVPLAVVGCTSETANENENAPPPPKVCRDDRAESAKPQRTNEEQPGHEMAPNTRCTELAPAESVAPKYNSAQGEDHWP